MKPIYEFILSFCLHTYCDIHHHIRSQNAIKNRAIQISIGNI